LTQCLSFTCYKRVINLAVPDGTLALYRSQQYVISPLSVRGGCADAGSSARGRWIPTTAVDQYAATLASWYGVSDGDLPAVFPNLARFGDTRLGFV
jgi:hypothetical protein